MLNTTTKHGLRTFVLSLRKPGIAGRLAISVVAVAILAVVANLIVEGKVSVLQRSRGGHTAPSPAAVSKPSAPLQTVAPAPIRPPFPSADPLLRALDRIDRAVDASSEGDVTELIARYPRLAAELDRAAAEFAAAARAAGETPPPRFNVTVRSYRQRAGDLIKLAASRRELMAEYSTHFEKLNTRVKKSLDHAWNIFGRVVARQSLVKLTGNLDDLRRRYAEFVAAYTVDSSTFDSLGASEDALASTLLLTPLVVIPGYTHRAT